MSNIESPQGYNLLEQYEKEVNERLNWLKNNIKLNTDPWITKYPKICDGNEKLQQKNNEINIRLWLEDSIMVNGM